MAEQILIVEDEFFIAYEMQRNLRSEGYTVLGVAADLDSAMNFARDNEIALALVDLNLRDGLTGPQIGEKLANEFAASVVFVTANPRDLGDGVAGTIGVLTKPTSKDHLLAVVEYALELRRGRTAQAPECLSRFG